MSYYQKALDCNIRRFPQIYTPIQMDMVDRIMKVFANLENISGADLEVIDYLANKGYAGPDMTEPEIKIRLGVKPIDATTEIDSQLVNGFKIQPYETFSGKGFTAQLS